MSLQMAKKPITIDDFIDSAKFAKMLGLKKHQLEYRVKADHVHPRPCKLKNWLVFDPDAEIIIPPPIRTGGRPKGSTIANGAKSRKYPRNGREIKKIKKEK
jgi:hypothetical protein